MNIFKWLSPKKYKKITSETTQKILREWSNIDSLVVNGGPSQLRQALIAADKTLDNVLRDLYPGETMGQRLISAKDKFDDVTYNRVWQAHKTRNALVHESGFEPSHVVLKDHVRNLRDAMYLFGIRLR